MAAVLGHRPAAGRPLVCSSRRPNYDRTRRSRRLSMAQYQAKPVLDTVDPVWMRVRREAEEAVKREPELATFIYSTILHHDTLEGSIVYRLSERLHHAALSREMLRQAYADALKDTPSIGDAFRADIAAVVDRDPATYRLLEPVLYY